ncbi:MAG TPA: hypothetical protein VNG89_12000, partial [Vicinamibacterales bacterium]|nr:hypothetical protein [Vicinamibacterales bacterium]
MSVARTRSQKAPRPTPPRHQSTTRRFVLVAAAAVALLVAGVVAFRALSGRTPAPPAVADLGPLAPEIA